MLNVLIKNVTPLSLVEIKNIIDLLLHNKRFFTD